MTSSRSARPSRSRSGCPPAGSATLGATDAAARAGRIRHRLDGGGAPAEGLSLLGCGRGFRGRVYGVQGRPGHPVGYREQRGALAVVHRALSSAGERWHRPGRRGSHGGRHAPSVLTGAKRPAAARAGSGPRWPRAGITSPASMPTPGSSSRPRRADHPEQRWIVADLVDLDLSSHGDPGPFDAAVMAGNVMLFVAEGDRGAGPAASGGPPAARRVRGDRLRGRTAATSYPISIGTPPRLGWWLSSDSRPGICGRGDPTRRSRSACSDAEQRPDTRS